MQNISAKELSALEDQLNYEQMLVKKYQAYAQQCSDMDLQTKCTQIASKHQEHFNKLMTYLQ